MLRFVAVAWNYQDPTQIKTADFITTRINETIPDMNLVLSGKGIRVFAAGLHSLSGRVYIVPKRRGIILGTLFAKPSHVDANLHITSFSDAIADELIASQGRYLVSNYWGRYVAFVHTAECETTWIIRDPSGGLPCFTSSYQSLNIFFSYMEDLIALDVQVFSINWRYVAAAASEFPIQGRETGLLGISEVQMGECVTTQSGVIVNRRLHWNPVEIVNETSIDRVDDAVAQVRSTVQTCVTAWASCYPNIVHMLSGGLDSSIVLACLARIKTRPQIRCINYYDTAAAGDERQFARLAAVRAQTKITEIHLDPTAVPAEKILGFARFASPTPWAEAFYTQTTPADLARQWGASAIFDGNFGDSLFFYYSDQTLRVADLMYFRGLCAPRLLGLSFRTAAMMRCSIWNVLFNGVKKGLLRPRCDPTAYFGKWRWFVTPEALQVGRNNQDLIPEYLMDRPRLAPGKFEQILGLSSAPAFYNPSGHSSDPEPVPVLTSQPLRELLFRIPTDVLTFEGVPRAIARKAFADDVPPEVSARSDKGVVNNFLSEFLKHNEKFIRDLLMDGLLVKNGVLDKVRLEDFFSGRKFTNIRISSELALYHFSIEAWAQSWSSGTKVRNAAA